MPAGAVSRETRGSVVTDLIAEAAALGVVLDAGAAARLEVFEALLAERAVPMGLVEIGRAHV